MTNFFSHFLDLKLILAFMEEAIKNLEKEHKAQHFLEKDELLRTFGNFRENIEISLERMDSIIQALRKDYEIYKSKENSFLIIGENDFDFYFCINGRFIRPRSYFEEK